MTEPMKKLDVNGRVVTMTAEEIASLPHDPLPPPPVGPSAPDGKSPAHATPKAPAA